MAGSRHTGHDLGDAPLPRRHHRPDRGGFGAEAGAGGRIDADTVEVRTLAGDERRRDIAEPPIPHPDGIDIGRGLPYQFLAHDLDASGRRAAAGAGATA